MLLTKCWHYRALIMTLGAFSLCCSGTPSTAQIVPDTTLPVNSRVIHTENTFKIDQGTTVGTNLFHSFEKFSVPTGSEAFFNNASHIQNIITRVTQSNISFVDGVIGGNGVANLFLINPNGIIFGYNASLNIGGSFFATTADSLVFSDGSEFSAPNPQRPPLLQVNIPIGLRFGTNSGAIHVQGKGHNLTVADENIPIFSRLPNSSQLEVSPGNTLALIANNITLDGGVLSTEGGNIELGSVTSGFVSLHLSPLVWNVTYDKVESFGDINLDSRALVDTSGFGGGSIEIQGKFVSLMDGSALLIQNQGLDPAKGIFVTSELINLKGTNATIRSGFYTQTLGLGKGGDILISTKNFSLENGASVSARTFSSAEGGLVKVDASESLELSGFSPTNNTLVSFISTTTSAAGDAGDIVLSTNKLRILNGSNTGSIAIASGSAGNVIVNAVESVEIKGINSAQFASTLASSTIGTGTAGNLMIHTGKLLLQDGGRISSTTRSSGAAGSVVINASESIELSGEVLTSINPTQIISSADILDPFLQQLFRLPPIPSGQSGEINISTPYLKITDGAQVTVSNDGTGNAGNLEIQANSIFLDKKGGITATTASGQGGNIFLNVRDNLQIHNNGLISATAGGAGNGGNITLNTSFLTLQDSDISASTETGIAGNLNINANNSVQLRGEGGLSVEATAENGTAGNVTIETPQISVLDGAKVTVSSPEGQAGNLSISAQNLSLNQGSITAETGKNEGEEGANISLNVSDFLRMENDSLISATANGFADGGNIDIDASFLIAFPPTGSNGSDIIAKAEQGNGGRIAINAEGIFGIEENLATPGNRSNDLDASSEAGASGEIILNRELDPNRGLVRFPENVVDPNALIAQNVCKQGSSSEFVVTGRGGLPPSPTSEINSEATQIELVQPAPINTRRPENGEIPQDNQASTSEQKSIVPARGWVFNEKGEIVLVSYNPSGSELQRLPENDEKCSS